ncbi:hypothetical protein DNTS_010295 [Danionella cerebrum]|uniref:Uncharacterized protein n=1 Tax=Danionella cerebrum TaxID=2873325 RepID=A0A553MRC1_9TELE|nr:hypothetical protein DNTS_010295 [Danionella translucida]
MLFCYELQRWNPHEVEFRLVVSVIDVSFPGCSAKRNFCSNNPCLNGASCVNLWGSIRCDCAIGFGGQRCERAMPNPMRFQGDGLLLWTDLAVAETVPWQLELMFRTRQPTATLIHMSSGQQHNLTVQRSERPAAAGVREYEPSDLPGALGNPGKIPVSTAPCARLTRMNCPCSCVSQLRGGFLMTSLQRGEDSALSRIDDVTVSDGQWHHILLELQDSESGGVRAVVSLDYRLYTVSVCATMELELQLAAVRLRTLSVGRGFSGCMQGLRVGELFPSMPQARVLNVAPGCSFPKVCGSKACPEHSDCTEREDTRVCSCHLGYYGNNCTDACSLNPCDHQSICSRTPDSAHGYTCSCHGNYFGQYCEKKVERPCPRGWWGGDSCGPCHCETAKGFDADCNKTSGACRCKDNHYRPPTSEACLLCACYAVGSFSRACDRESGQCQCKPGVIGRRCDRCDNPFAEVSPGGCEVIYDSCPQAIEAGIWWPRTKFGLPAAVSCPKGSTGTAVRHCDEHKGWLAPDLFDCSSVSFTKLKSLSEHIARNASLIDSANVPQTLALLFNATRNTEHFYGSDVKAAYHLIRWILRHESEQQGFNLSATQDVLFNEHLTQVASAILRRENQKHWQQIQQTESGSAALLQQLEEYTQTLARNLRQTYLNPFTIVTPNIVLSVERLSKVNFKGGTLPRSLSLRGARPLPLDLSTSVSLPNSLFDPAPEGKGQRSQGQLHTEPERNQTANQKRRRRHPEREEEEDAIASVLIFRSLAPLLPERFDRDKRSLRVPKRPVINTPVVSIMVHDREEQLQHTLQQPITVQFRLLATEERSKPICVFWNHSLGPGGPGGWSARGCEVVFRNQTHISCHCYHLTSFAVLMDISRRENGEVLPVKLVTWSSVAVALFFLFLTVLVLACLRYASSNRASIAKNIAATLFIAHLVFILGVNQTENPFVCTLIAILLLFSWLCVFSWLSMEALHSYRMLSERRDVNSGPMRFYGLMGWGVPALITGLSVGLDPQGFGNPDFCWISLHDMLVWSFAGPLALVLTVSGDSLSIYEHVPVLHGSASTVFFQREEREPSGGGALRLCAAAPRNDHLSPGADLGQQ